MGNREIQILCYADDALLTDQSEDDLDHYIHYSKHVRKKTVHTFLWIEKPIPSDLKQ